MHAEAKVHALKRGDRISLIAPSGAAADPDRAVSAARALRSLGFDVAVAPGCTQAYGYLAGSDAQRASDFQAAFADPETRGVVCLKGGYGTPRMLDRIDWSVVARNPKPFAGYSDITGLHLAIARTCGFPSFHAPMPSSDMLPDFDPDSRASFLRALCATEPLGVFVNPDGAEISALRGGRAEGVLAGGNLSLVAACMGTPWELDARGKILFFEDIDEAPYRVDRMLTQLRLAGKFDDCAGIVLGAWTNCVAPEGRRTLSLERVFDDIFPRDKPVLAGLQVGHCAPTLTLPLGVRCRIDAESGIFEALESACVP
ncbi:MAG: LD-carboxypeptidase [Rectinemataceae bacterium]